MNRQSQKKNRHLFLKLASLALGFLCWYMVMHQHNQYKTLSIPVCFHDTPKNMTINAPEMIGIDIRASRIDLETINLNSVAFNIDAQSLKTGCNTIPISEDQLFLPDHVSLLNCTPSTILVYMHEKTTSRRTKY